MVVYITVFISAHQHTTSILAGKRMTALSKNTITDQPICCFAVFSLHLFYPLEEITIIGSNQNVALLIH